MNEFTDWVLGKPATSEPQGTEPIEQQPILSPTLSPILSSSAASGATSAHQPLEAIKEFFRSELRIHSAVTRQDLQELRNSLRTEFSESLETKFSELKRIIDDHDNELGRPSDGAADHDGEPDQTPQSDGNYELPSVPLIQSGAPDQTETGSEQKPAGLGLSEPATGSSENVAGPSSDPSPPKPDPTIIVMEQIERWGQQLNGRVDVLTNSVGAQMHKLDGQFSHLETAVKEIIDGQLKNLTASAGAQTSALTAQFSALETNINNLADEKLAKSKLDEETRFIQDAEGRFKRSFETLGSLERRLIATIKELNERPGVAGLFEYFWKNKEDISFDLTAGMKKPPRLPDVELFQSKDNAGTFEARDDIRPGGGAEAGTASNAGTGEGRSNGAGAADADSGPSEPTS